MEMEHGKEPDIYAINLNKGIVVTDDDRILPITNMFDIQGNETDDPALAVAGVAKGGETEWFVFAVSNFERGAVN